MADTSDPQAGAVPRDALAFADRVCRDLAEIVMFTGPQPVLGPLLQTALDYREALQAAEAVPDGITALLSELTADEWRALSHACEAQGNIHDRAQLETGHIGKPTRGQEWHDLAQKVLRHGRSSPHAYPRETPAPSAPSDAAVAGRLQALAQVGARWKHDIACCSIEAPFPRIGHDRAFDQCRHPDCVLVRAALQEAPHTQGGE